MTRFLIRRGAAGRVEPTPHKRAWTTFRRRAGTEIKVMNFASSCGARGALPVHPYKDGYRTRSDTRCDTISTLTTLLGDDEGKTARPWPEPTQGRARIARYFA